MFSTKMPLFGKSSKSPTEVVRNLKEDLLVLEKGGDAKKLEKARKVVKAKKRVIFSVAKNFPPTTNFAEMRDKVINKMKKNLFVVVK